MVESFPAYRGDAPYLFVSYAHDDGDQAHAEMARLRQAGFNVWYDEGIRPGEAWREEVALALTQCSLFVYLVTPNSARSENCHQELNFALSRERRILAIHLQPTDLTVGIELSLSNKQAIMKHAMEHEAYQEKLTNAVQDLLPAAYVALPDAQKVDPGPRPPGERSIAILPLANRSSDPENEYLCDGIAEELTSGLARIEDLQVASQLSSFALKHEPLGAREIGDRLNVAHVLTGSVQKAGDRVRVTMTLTEAAPATVSWSEQYNGTLDDIFELQENIAGKVIEALQSRFAPQDGDSVLDTGTSNRVAYDLFMRGQHQYSRYTRSGRRQAVELLEAAVAEDPTFGRAWSVLFQTLHQMVNSREIPQQELTDRGGDIVAAIRGSDYVAPVPDRWFQDAMHPEQQSARKDWPMEAIEVIRRGDTSWRGWELSWLATGLIDAGLLEGALRYLELYLSTHPQRAVDTNVPATNGNLLFRLGRFDKAVEVFTQDYALYRNPQSLGTRAMAYSRTGQFDAAQRDLNELATYFPRNFAQFYDLYWRRETDAANAYFEWMESRSNLAPLFKVWGCFLTGNIERAFDHMESSQQPWNPFGYRLMCLFPLTPSLISQIEAHPRYQAALAGFGLDDAWRGSLLEKVRALEPITGIRVDYDEGY